MKHKVEAEHTMPLVGIEVSEYRVRKYSLAVQAFQRLDYGKVLFDGLFEGFDLVSTRIGGWHDIGLGIEIGNNRFLFCQCLNNPGDRVIDDSIVL